MKKSFTAPIQRRVLFSNHRRPVKLTYGTFGRTTPENH